MKRLYTALLVSALGFGTSAQNYTVNFLKGTREFSENVNEFTLESIEESNFWEGKTHQFIQFYEIPTESDQAKLSTSGIELLEYIPNVTFIASISENSTADFADLGIRSIQPIELTYKQSQRIQDANYPDWSLSGSNIKLYVSFYNPLTLQSVEDVLQKDGITIVQTSERDKTAFIEASPEKIQTIVEYAFVKFVDVIPDPGTPESDEGRYLHRSNAINRDYYGARNYDGTGVNIAINDDGYVGPHIDFQNRLNQDDVASDFTGAHGDMVAGIAGGAGNLNPIYRGMAPGAYMHIRQYTTSNLGPVSLHTDSNVLLYSSSYSNGCNDGYTPLTHQVDEDIYENPTLIQVFSAGNSNNLDCGYGAGSQWGNITGGHKMGKNVITTANLRRNDVIETSSSRGPANDGRIKPDIAAHGTDQVSTDPDNNYEPGGGTSAAAPGIAGVLAQLHQAYRELNGGQTARSALLKATLLNTANDLGNDGPDFIFGWGKVNALKAVTLLEDNRYFNDSVSQGDTNTHMITIPENVLRAKIMVYWADKEGSTAAATALVNDLDAVITDPGSGAHLPWLLDHTPTTVALSAPAGTGTDHLNNVEQIAIDNPAPGTYALDVAGTTVPFGPQEYDVVYEFLTEDITVIHPMGGEGLVPGTTEQIHWDAYDDGLGDFTIEYTEDNGGTWNTISTTAGGSERFYDWNVPNTITGEARIRISRGGASDESDANFSIVSRPLNIEIFRICTATNTIVLRWDSVPGATGYDVFMLGQKYMDSISSTAATEFGVVVPDLADPQWFSARATGPNGLRSTRQIAIHYPGGYGSTFCVLECTSDNDVGVSSIQKPEDMFEVCDGVTSSEVTIHLENLGLNTESNFPVYYQFNNEPIVSETYNGLITAGGTGTHTFGTPIDLSTNPTHTLKIWTGLTSDSTRCNDTIIQIITVSIPTSAFPVSEDFEGAWPPQYVTAVDNPDDDMTWEDITVTGSTGGQTTVAWINNYSYSVNGERDAIELITYDLSGFQMPAFAYLTFDVAYRQYSSIYSDDLQVDASSDCRVSYNTVYFKNGQSLATGPNSWDDWEPTSPNHWRNDTIDLTSYIGSEVSLRFINICGYGNNMYIDNINMEAYSTAGLDESTVLQLTMVPNPASGETTLFFGQELTEGAHVELVSMDGKRVQSQSVPSGATSSSIDLKGLTSAVYFVHVTTNGQYTVRKLVVKK